MAMTTLPHEGTDRKGESTVESMFPIVEQKWTTKHVADRIEEAFSTLLQLPTARPHGSISWPKVIQDALETCGWKDAVLRQEPPPAEAIARMNETMEWLQWLEPEMIRLVWLRAMRAPWKVVVARTACDRTTAWRKWNVALHRIASRLEAAQEKVLQHQQARHLHQNLL